MPCRVAARRRQVRPCRHADLTCSAKVDRWSAAAIIRCRRGLPYQVARVFILLPVLPLCSAVLKASCGKWQLSCLWERGYPKAGCRRRRPGGGDGETASRRSARPERQSADRPVVGWETGRAVLCARRPSEPGRGRHRTSLSPSRLVCSLSGEKNAVTGLGWPTG